MIEREELEQEFSMLELRKAVFNSKKEKVAGSDGFNVEFYQEFFEELKYLLLDICRIVAKEGLHTSARQGIITLIEKSGAQDKTFLSNWCPLSLLNCDGKFYAKMIAYRLEKVTPQLIHSDQSGFLKGRSINENLLDLVSIIDYAEIRKLDALILSFDFEKAFDKVNFKYLDCVLKAFNFSDNLRQMIVNAHKDTSSCTINGGHSSKYMNINWGLRQGSPLSPVLFDYAVEFLGLAIRQNEKIQGIQIGNRQKKHAQYADDLWAAIMATQGSLDELMKIFDTFAKLSGLSINLEKTQVLRIGNLKNKGEFKLKTEKPLIWTDRMKVLGVTISANKEKMLKENYNNLVEKMKKVLNPWTARSLSLAGKVTIVNSLILSQATYKFLCLDSPDEKIFSRIRKMITEFIWDGKKAKIAYRTLIRSKEEGGLQLVDVSKKDEALKIAWVKRAQTTSNVWLDIANEILPIDALELFECSISPKVLNKMGIPKNTVIYSILRAWTGLHHSDPATKSEILNKKLWFNTHITHKKKSFVMKKMHK